MNYKYFIKQNLFIINMIVSVFLVVPGQATAGQEKNKDSSYAEQLKVLEKKLYTGKNAIKVGDKDLAVMNQAGADLAAKMPEPGLKIGDSAPDFLLKNPYGKTVSLSTELKKGPVVLVFYRGAWCPYCNLQLHMLKKTLPEIKQYGATLIAVTPQKPDMSLGQIEKDGYSFEILSDLNDKVIKSYKLYWEVSEKLDAAYKHSFGLDITKFNGENRLGLPVPGTFIIDSNSIVRAAFSDTDYRKRMEPADILMALKKIAL